jgi:hypothetical protein
MIVTVFIGLFIALSVLAFIFVAFMFPEWVGIAGKKSKEIEADHRPQKAADSSSTEEKGPK